MKPFEGVRVIEAAQMISAPMAGMILAEQGADVVKVEVADGVGDRMRMVGTRRGDVSTVFHAVNRGKRSIALDSKDPRGLEILQQLIADLVAQYGGGNAAVTRRRDWTSSPGC